MGATRRPADRSAVRFVRAPLGVAPSLTELVAAIADEPYPFVFSGRWGLNDEAGAGRGAVPDPNHQVVVAGAAPSRLVPHDETDPFAAFDDVPPLVGHAPAGAVGGGLVGWLGYELGRTVERTLGHQPPRPQPLPPAQLGWYDDVLRRDEDGVWWVEALVSADGSADVEGSDDGAFAQAVERWRLRLGVAPSGSRRLPEPEILSSEPVARLGMMWPSAGTTPHVAAVAETIERIRAGELFQANVCLRLEGTLEGRAAGLVAPVLEAAAPRYGAWIDAGEDRAIVSASPELFLRRRGRDVVTGPIKGTAPRPEGGTDPAADDRATELASSEKDGAEHVMIVDLMRNDLGRACDYGSIWWDDVPRVEPHAGVWHLVSHVGGRLHEGLGDRALLRATFPPGSVTGAPKVQAMRVIGAVEGTAREVYTGAHGLSSPVSGLELAVTIRTIELAGDRAWIGAGGGIVADSVPGAELSEALGKASALVTAAGGRLAMRGTPPALASSPMWMRSADRRPDPSRGVLGTLRVEEGRALHLGRHLRRIRGSLAALGYPPAPDDLETRIAALAATAVTPGRLRVLATHPSPSAAETEASRAPGRSAAPQEQSAVELQLIPIMATGVGTGPVALAPAIVPGGIGAHKYLDRDLIDALTARVGATPLLLEAGGEVLEAGWANLWWLDDDGLVTPPLDGRLLPGVTRGVLLERRERSPVPVREGSARLDEIAERPLLLTSSRGVSVARLASTPPAALARATELAQTLAPLVADEG